MAYRLVLNSRDDGQGDQESSGDLLVQPKTSSPKLAPPPMYRVVLINDDYTPMDFVVEVLEFFFAMDRERATRVMLDIHTKGKAICGTYTRDIAETKATQVVEYARENQHPLMCQVEQA